MNYSDMSDIEISKAVGDLLGVKWAFKDAKNDILAVWNGAKIESFNPCASWGDAGKIIEENKISFLCDFDHPDWLAYSDVNLYGQGKTPRFEGFKSSHENPLRAAMIVFLMIKAP